MMDLSPAPSPILARRSPFDEGLPQFQVAWDSTSLGLLKECPRKYYYEIILGWRSAGQNVHLTFGLGYHASLEAYDHARVAGADHEEALRVAVRTALATGGVRSADGSWHGWRSTDHYKNIWTLVRTVVWYADHFRNDQMHTILLSSGKPAVELSFFFDGGEINGIPVGYCGHMDRVALDGDGRTAVHDRKTTKSQLNAQYYDSFNPHGQFALYTIASLVTFDQPAKGIVVDAAQVGVNFSRFGRRFISFPQATLDEFLRESNTWIANAQRYAETGFWPRNDKACGNYGGCAFRRVCSKSEHHRQSWLEADFRPFRWNPLEVRGDI